MATRLRLEIHIPDLSPDLLRRLVHKWDEKESGEGQGIAPENVKEIDVLTYLVLENDVVWESLAASMEEE